MTHDDLLKMEIGTQVNVVGGKIEDQVILRVIKGWIYVFRSSSVFVPEKSKDQNIWRKHTR